MATLGSAAEAVEASWSAQAGSVSVGVGDSLVAPSGSSSSHWRCRLLCCSVVRSGACRCNWLTVVAVDVCPAAVAAGDVAAVAAAADPPSGVVALRVARMGAREK